MAESPPLNRSKAAWASASQAAEYLAAYLNLQPVGGETLCRPSVRPEPSADLLRYTVTLKINHALEAAPEEVH